MLFPIKHMRKVKRAIFNLNMDKYLDLEQNSLKAIKYNWLKTGLRVLGNLVRLQLQQKAVVNQRFWWREV